MKPFIIIDRFILNRVENLSHCLQKTFGLGCQLTANLLYGGFIVHFVCTDVARDISHKRYWMLFLDVPVTLVYSMVYFVVNPWIGKINNELNARGHANSSKINPRSIRMRLIGLFLAFLFTVLNLIAPTGWGLNMALITLSEYFQACDDLPPGKSRVRKLVDAIKSFGLNPVSVTQ